MKNILIISVCFLSLFCTAQTTPKKNNTEQEIRKLTKDWTIAIMKRDEKTLNKIVAPEYKLDGTYPFDKPPVTRKMWMTNLQLLRFDSAHYYDMKVDVIDNVAIVQSKSFWSGQFGDRPPFVDSTCMLVDTWMKRKQGWQVVSRLRVDKPE